MNIRVLLLTALYGLYWATISANPIKIVGRVCASNDSAYISGATVRLMDEQDRLIIGTVSDSVGCFSLSSDLQKPTKLEISSIGYIPVTIGISNATGVLTLGDILMEEDSKTLKEVVVASRLRRFNRQLVFPDKLQVKTSQDFMALLQNLSLTGLDVDPVNKNATIHGKAVQWKINGVPRSVAEVKNLKPEDILRIDYSDMPSTRELDNGYGGVIDVILKERTDGGSLNTHLQSALWVGFVNASASGNYHQGKSELSIDYSTSYRNYPKWKQFIEQQFVGGDVVINHLETPENSPFKNADHNFDINYSYKPNNKQIFSATLRNGFAFGQTDIRSNIARTNSRAFHRTSKSEYHGYTPALDLYYQNNLHNGGKIEVNLVGTYSSGKNERNLVDKQDQIEIATVSNPVNTRYRSLIGEIAYEKAIHSKVYLNAGLQEKYSYTSNDYISPDTYNDNMHQNNVYLYAQIFGNFFRQLQYQVGTGIKQFYVKRDADNKAYWKNQSNVAFYYYPSNSIALTLNSSFTPVLPTLAQLSGVVQRYDDLIVYTGNGALKPAYLLNNRLNGSFQKGRFNSTVSLNYNYTYDPIFTKVSYEAVTNDFVFKPENGKYYRQYGAEWKVSYKNIWDILAIYATMGWNRYESNIGANPLHVNSFYWNVSAQMAYKNYIVAMFYKKTGKSLYGETAITPGNNAGLTMMYKKANLTVYAQMMYIGIKAGDTYTTTNYSKVNPDKSYITIPENANMLTLGIVWNMDFGKRKTAVNRSLSNYDKNESVLKVQE